MQVYNYKKHKKKDYMFVDYSTNIYQGTLCINTTKDTKQLFCSNVTGHLECKKGELVFHQLLWIYVLSILQPNYHLQI